MKKKNLHLNIYHYAKLKDANDKFIRKYPNLRGSNLTNQRDLSRKPQTVLVFWYLSRVKSAFASTHLLTILDILDVFYPLLSETEEIHENFVKSLSKSIETSVLEGMCECIDKFKHWKEQFNSVITQGKSVKIMKNYQSNVCSTQNSLLKSSLQLHPTFLLLSPWKICIRNKSNQMKIEKLINLFKISTIPSNHFSNVDKYHFRDEKTKKSAITKRRGFTSSEYWIIKKRKEKPIVSEIQSNFLVLPFLFMQHYDVVAVWLTRIKFSLEMKSHSLRPTEKKIALNPLAVLLIVGKMEDSINE